MILSILQSNERTDRIWRGMVEDWIRYALRLGIRTIERLTETHLLRMIAHRSVWNGAVPNRSVQSPC